jgi:hypothetical protein
MPGSYPTDAECCMTDTGDTTDCPRPVAHSFAVEKPGGIMRGFVCEYHWPRTQRALAETERMLRGE